MSSDDKKDVEAKGDFEEITTNDGEAFDLSNLQPYHSTFNDIGLYTLQHSGTSGLNFGDDVSRVNLWSPPPPTASIPRLDESTVVRGSPTTPNLFSPGHSRPASTPVDKKIVESSKSNILSIVSLLNEHILAHPFVVVRRQAQVNHRSLAYHLTPFTVVPVIARLQARQGVATFFKGLPSSLLNYVLLLGSESILLSFLQLPAEFDFSLTRGFNAEELGKHLLLKALAYTVVTPFICSGAVEMVQSLIVGELPSPFESLCEGFARVMHIGNDRKLPFYRLVLPSVAYHLARYVLVEMTKELIYYFYYKEAELEQQDEPQPQQSAMNVANESRFFKTIDHHQQQQAAEARAAELGGESRIRLNRLKCSLLAHLLTDVVLYPFETIIFRLFLQGTRTLIDNVDGRTAVIPLITSYDDASDCYDTILRDEGAAGLYKGFGALLLQYGLQYSVIHLTNFCIQTIFA